jgi:hypothetical protein
MTESARTASSPPPPLRQAFENRVDAIMRVRDLPRPEAERLAFEAAVIDWLNATHPDTLFDRCAHCGKRETPNAILLRSASAVDMCGCTRSAGRHGASSAEPRPKKISPSWAL